MGEFLQKGIVQILFYYNQNEGDNITFSDEIYLKRFEDSTGGSMLWLGETPLNSFQACVPKIFSINVGENPG